ncbi:hypothetical protein [Paraburkholderia caffeinilytica]|uniref:hypothetical protein n=1 Tax=Paraburkholderia caffeinilytica TaxID=1761016 RepID=UPI0038B7A42E
MAIRSKYYETVKNNPLNDWPGTREVLTDAGTAYLLQHGQMPPRDDGARADSTVTGDGLKMTVRYDEANRPIREFSNTGTRKRWMLDFTSPAYQMLRITNKPQTVEQNARFETEWRATQAMIASGNIQLPEV